MSEITLSAVGPYPENDERLLSAASAGDEDAWEQLYRRIYPRLWAYLVRRVGAGQAEDAVNDTMTRAMEGIGRFEPRKASFDAWVFGIARHVAVDLHRRQVRSERHRLLGGGEFQNTEGLPEDVTLIAEEHELLRWAYNRLLPVEREILELRVIAQLSAEETAAALGKRPGAVRTAQSRALSRLRHLLEEHGA